jgi:transmembrane sensor
MLQLFKKYLNDQCTPAEVEALLAHFNVQEDELLLRDIIMQNLEMEDTLPDSKAAWSNAVDETYVRIKKQIAAEKKKMIPLFKRKWFQVAAAAILLFGVFTFYKLGLSKNDIKQQVAKTNSEDIAPGSNKAVLTLADGSQIVLDSAANGNLTKQGNTTIIKLDGKLAYSASGNNGEVLYNTISTPKGGMYQIVLSDGSKVWLNASSSLRFPTAFTGKQRNVELSGEAYFEIEKNALMPFNVAVSEMNVQVLGTHFNVMAYNEESEIKTTLLEGAVKVTKGSAVALLKPGKQASLDNSGAIKITDAEIEKDLAWKNGMFFFENTGIKTIMQQLNRWYDADISYQGNVTNRRFTGQISRYINLSGVLKMLELTGDIPFKIEGKKILVTP